MVTRTVGCLAALVACVAASAQTVYTYIGQIGSNSVLIAWGTAEGRSENTIGRDSTPLGAAEVKIAGRTIPVSDHNWVQVTDLQPDTAYPYEVDINGRRVGGSVVRTWPA